MSRSTRYSQAFQAAQPVLSIPQLPSQAAIRAAMVPPSSVDGLAFASSGTMSRARSGALSNWIAPSSSTVRPSAP